MREARVSLPELGLIAGTRGALGFGLGLLLSGRWTEERRRGIGWALFLFGLVTTVPLALDVLGRCEEPAWPVGALCG
jgi:hypothetical protein